MRETDEKETGRCSGVVQHGELVSTDFIIFINFDSA